MGKPRKPQGPRKRHRCYLCGETMPGQSGRAACRPCREVLARTSPSRRSKLGRRRMDDPAWVLHLDRLAGRAAARLPLFG